MVRLDVVGERSGSDIHIRDDVPLIYTGHCHESFRPGLNFFQVVKMSCILGKGVLQCTVVAQLHEEPAE